MEKKKVYIMLSYTGSMFSRLIAVFSKDKYTHISIGFDEGCERLYSFGRLTPYNPFHGGFVEEGKSGATFKRFPKTICSVYSFEIDIDKYKALEKELTKFKSESSKYKYNYIGVFSAYFNRPYKMEYCYFCSQFVAEVLINSGLLSKDIDPALISPMKIAKKIELKHVYTGLLRSFPEVELANRMEYTTTRDV